MKKSVSKNKLLLFIFFLGLFFVAASINTINQVQAAVCTADTFCDYGAGENMFNCRADCLPAGVPTKPVGDVIRDAISWTLGFAISISVAIFIWGGVYYVTSSGNTEKAEKAKKIVKYALMGLAVAGISYAILVIIDAIFGP